MLVPAAMALAAPDLPKAIYTDPAPDPAHPADTLAVELTSHGAVMNGIVYRPSGPGPFPLVIFCHGLPGNEQSLDLAQAMRRAGWAVLTFHYRGAFGSEGDFSIDNALADADAVIDHVRAPGVAKAWNVDPARIVTMGHSLGGLATAHMAAHAPERLGSALLAPWDPSILAGLLRPMSLPEREAAALARWGDVGHGRLHGIGAGQIAAEIVDHGERWRLGEAAPSLATRPLLIVTVVRDLPSSQAGGLRAGLAKLPKGRVEAVELDTDHSFNDHRIALEIAVLDWLARLPGAPPQP